MLNVLSDVEAARQEAEQLFAEGVARRFPLALSHLAVQIMLRNKGIPAPKDMLAWVSQGKASDSMIRNWESATGG